MTQDFRDRDTAQQWDAHTTSHNPDRVAQLDLLLTILADTYQPGDVILDLGFGSGQVEALIFERIPGAQVIGVDASPAMMALAAERLKPCAGQMQMIEHDLAELATLPVEPCRFIISSQALHHLSDAQMQAAYGSIRDLLTPDGLLLLIDRVAPDPPELFDIYQSLWRWQDQQAGSDVFFHEGSTYDAHVEVTRQRGDQPLSLPRHLELMAAAGLRAACLHLSGIRAVVAARKPA